MRFPDFASVTGYLASRLGEVARPVASFSCDIVDAGEQRDRRGHTQPGEPRTVNATPIPCQVRDVTGQEIFVSGRRVVVSGTLITFARLHNGVRLDVAQNNRVRVRAAGHVPERLFEIEHVGDEDGVQVTLVVRRLRS